MSYTTFNYTVSSTSTNSISTMNTSSVSTDSTEGGNEDTLLGQHTIDGKTGVVNVTVTVKNTGTLAGATVVAMFHTKPLSTFVRYVGAPRGLLYAGCSTQAAPRRPLHGGWLRFFLINADVRSILMVLRHLINLKVPQDVDHVCQDGGHRCGREQ